MPHSSGGGSHGGGSHGGSHSSGGGGGTGSSRSYYSGCKHRYVYYHNNKPRYIYTNKTLEELTKPAPIFMKIISCIFMIPFLALGVVMFVASFAHVRPIDMDYDDTKIYIEDELGVIKDEKELKSVLKEFQQKTGVTPAVVTVPDSIWDRHYTSLENYAYDVYVNQFDDEKHWLIVYSEPDYVDGFLDWKWEGMQGDDTNPAIPTRKADEFNEVFQKGLTKESMSVDEAYIAAFQNYIDNMDQMEFDPAIFAFALLWTGFTVYAIYNVTYADIKFAKQTAAAYEVQMAKNKREEKLLELTCQYCGGIYVKNPYFRCPHCGALTEQGYDEQQVNQQNDYTS